ncbi:glycosyltransferase family 4 protein [Candidatus Peregrinibacteria bacterium CG10_big_fil_rev_8_21_14_0_10_55_24]|nr:MAG: glycosyltransferase family 4 protein [Candidatus Peregrinibacteria bacterium CG10_big_fil_rev_8_21_14_0_10_55_24]
MRVALVHELLTIRGGAERTLKVIADMFPNAPIYTLLYDEEKLGNWFPKERIRTSTVQNSLLHTAYSILHTANNHHLYLPFFPSAVEAWDFCEHDLVISSSSAFAHGIITNGKPKHLSYIHSPARYLWDRTHEVLARAGKGPLGPLKRRYLERAFHKLRLWDAEVSDRADMLIAASKEVKRRIELYWRRESSVLYPPLDDFWFEEQEGEGRKSEEETYLVVSTLVPYKRIELAVDACTKGGKRLTVVGEGPERKRLEERAGSTVEFLGYQPQQKLKELYARATATIFPGDEDFGLVPLESMACSTPVVAYRKGGALETVIEGETGVYFCAPNPDDLLAALETVSAQHFDTAKLTEHTRRFSRARFEEGLHSAVDRVMAH